MKSINSSGKPTLSTLESEDLQEEAMSASQVSFYHSMMRLGDDLFSSIVNGTPQYTAKDFYARYVLRIASDDKDESEYALKHLSREIGGTRRAFVIVDDETKKPLFFIPQLTLPTSSGRSSYMNKETMSHQQSPLKGFASVESRYAQFVKEIGDHLLDVGHSKDRFYDGWYEIFDYFGILFGSEEAHYARVREDKRNNKQFTFWCHDMSMYDYIDKYGRPQYPDLIKPIDYANIVRKRLNQLYGHSLPLLNEQGYPISDDEAKTSHVASDQSTDVRSLVQHSRAIEPDEQDDWE